MNSVWLCHLTLQQLVKKPHLKGHLAGTSWATRLQTRKRQTHVQND